MPLLGTRGGGSVQGFGRGNATGGGGAPAFYTSGVAARNAGNTTSGWYPIKTSGMATARQVYVNMTDDGGGWMLISYKPNNTTGGIGYPGAWSNGEGTLNHLTVRVEDLWYHNGSAQCTSVLKMGKASATTTPDLASFTIANKVVYSNPGILNLWEGGPTGSSTFVADASALNGTWSPIKGHTAMTSSLTVIAPSDWLYNQGNSFYWTPCGPSTDTTSLRSGNAQGTGSWMNTMNTDFYGLSDVAAGASSNTLGAQSIAVFVR